MPRASKLWNYFEKSEDHDLMAICQFCSKLFSYKTTSSNLKAHLKQKHPLVYKDLLQPSDTPNVLSALLNNDESNNSTGEPDIWSFFEKETGGRARCVVCRASLPHRIRDLRHHLKENHPKLAQSFEQGSDSDDIETYEEVVYLEEETRTNKKPKNQRIFTASQLKPAKISKLSSSFDNERHDEYDDQIMKFSNYVASLLKEVPKDACMKLQMEIINLIMTTKLKLPSETENKMIIDGVPVSIQAVSSVPGTGFIVTVPTTVSAAPTPVVTGDKPTIPFEEHRDIEGSECRDLPKL